MEVVEREKKVERIIRMEVERESRGKSDDLN